MKAHVIEDGIVVNTIEVSGLDFMPSLVAADAGGIDWLFDGVNFTDPNAKSQSKITAAQEQAIRNQRDKMIADTDWMALSDNTLTAEWATYRQALRDITIHANFPHLTDADWPAQPE